MSIAPQDGQDQTADSLDAPIVVRTMKDQNHDPNRRFDDRIVLRDTTRIQITATHSEIIDQNTGEFHHNAVKIKSQSKSSPTGVNSAPKTIWIDDNGRDEIRRLRDFLSVVQGGIPEAIGRYMVVRLEDGQDQADALYRLIEMASSSAKAVALIKAIDGVSLDSDALHELIELASNNQDAVKAWTAALNIARYRDALATLEALIQNNAAEVAFQNHLKEHHWLFGTEYGELLDLRHATRDEQQDFIIRRTTDDYIEIIEIKTTLAAQPLFNHDPSHDCHYPSAPLAKVVGQIINYIEQLDADRESLLRRNGLDTNKIRAKIVIGRSGDAAQLKALRNFNGHVHRIEVITFDQLVRIGRRVLDHLESVIEQRTETQASIQVVWGEDGSLWDESDPPF